MRSGTPMSLVGMYVLVVLGAGAAARAAAIVGGLYWNGEWAWIWTLAGMVLGGLAAARYVSVRMDDSADAAAALARGEPLAKGDGPSVLEFTRLTGELHAAGAMHRRTSETLRELRHEQDALMDAVEGGVLALDREQRIINLNRAAERMLGIAPRSPEATRGALLQEVARYDALNRFVTESLAAGGSLSEEFQLAQPMKEGGRIGFSVRASSRPLADAQGQLEGVLVFLTDVTRLRRLEAVRTDFAANVSHELRTPITNIRGYVDTLVESGVNDPESAREFLKVVQRNAVRLSHIVDDMLALTNLERPDTAENLMMSPTALSGIIGPVLDVVELERSQKNVPISVEGDASLRAMVSGRLIEQALQNLVSNAIRYGPAGGKVVVRCGVCELPDGKPGVEMAVIDQGPGIAAEHLPRVFERFYRVDRARSRDQGGTGLGLSIVKHIALAHGGKVSVESTLGRGSTFRLRLPAA
ncbi:MAG: sensor histidine kinase [Phycisphaerales bacterium]